MPRLRSQKAEHAELEAGGRWYHTEPFTRQAKPLIDRDRSTPHRTGDDLNGLAVSRDDAERLRFWSGRKAAFPAVGRISPDYYCMDGTIPKKRLGEVLNFIGAMEKKYGLRCPNVFHAGDGNLHPLILFDANDPDQLHRTEAFANEVLEKCVAVGGTITGEHGVGVEKIDQMCVQFAAPELEAFHAIKRVFDAKGLLNPGKGVPTLVRCAERGRMHVKAGQLPHPELPRF